MTDKLPPVPMWLKKERAKALRYSTALRRLLGTGLKPLTYDEEACKWNGALLPLEPMDRGYMMERDVEHGTTAGYQYHRRNGQTPCDDCRTAQSDYNRESRQRKLRNQTNGRTEETIV